MITQFCMECGKRMKLRWPGDDPEVGPARMACEETTHEAPADLVQRMREEGAGECLGQVLTILEKHLDASGDDGGRPEVYAALRALRKDLIEEIAEIPEQVWDMAMASEAEEADGEPEEH